ncbi:unnamed protein product [Staurois parvus]|uniref:Uncharacterized protein n=1 Tax=Staurois parvus TaxID=386267 RepID=A0ABN9CXR0_9NEOB|nr:unnamed protein product [Staurois parvus]
MCSLIGQSVITCKVVSKMSLVTSLLLRVKSVNDHRGHMVQGYSQQPCTM